MKKILNYFLPALLLMTGFVSCKKEENRIYMEGGTAPVLTASTTSSMVLLLANKNNTAIKFDWTNPNYEFTTGPSSQDVSYLLQIDKAGANFGSEKKFERGISKNLTTTFTVGELNTAILGMDLEENIAHNLEIRLRSAIGSAVPLYSNVINIVVTPYLDVVYPVPDKLFITGGATPGNWMGGGDPELASQQFTKVSNSDFEIASLALTGDQGFLFVPVYGDWNNKYGFDGNGMENNVNGDNFRPGGNDMKAPPSGNYKIRVSFKTGKYTLTKL